MTSTVLGLIECAVLGAILALVGLLALELGLSAWSVIGWAAGGGLVGLRVGLVILPEPAP